MKQYLLDTNICAFLMRGKFGVSDHLLQVGIDNCHISEITLAELLYGAENSDYRERNMRLLQALTKAIDIIPIREAIPFYASEKARLRRSGTPIGTEQNGGNLDLFIGATAVTYGMVMVTENTPHFRRIKGIELENWVDRSK